MKRPYLKIILLVALLKKVFYHEIVRLPGKLFVIESAEVCI